ncbi:protein phosphatase 2C domain-containing protein [Leptolyngbya sp. CCNP1308]|uniref:PP2C family protein-serine/threonine phosphatase n=1 Tax=Leptolyngbya sp. CCNP1308 TaxID=3110255 RepID=UPI002B2062D6|nr:protein phosphatase 2C domain-containing protein [Leptolyngbya sp. CCNP1308]MEA5447706.1 protein phosphatase 2C domain-containing protein [Leptolyngbya sp. CCNP1308]
MIQCSNPSCRSVSTPPASRCKVCQTPLLYRFLLAVSDGPLTVRSGTLVAGRFLAWGDGQKRPQGGHQLWLDTRPDTPTPPLDKIPASVLAYQKLFHLAQHVPRPYAYLTSEQTGITSTVLLLEGAPIGMRLHPQAANEKGELPGQGKIEAAILPSLSQRWAEGSPLEQLNWLRQVAALWPTLVGEQVATTLLDLDDLRIDGALLRLTRLVADAPSPTLAQLGQRWQSLGATAQPPVRSYLGWLIKALKDGGLTSAQDLVAELEGAIETLAQGLLVTVDWAADTDQGPTRDRNEDACYPENDPRQQRLPCPADRITTLPLLLVCDGIGGHEQGSVASQTAIKLLQQELEPLTQQAYPSPGAIAQCLKQALILANDAISARNNDEHRSARARMGTTVVVALVHFPYVSIAHIGDSRAYRISPHTCYQITVDDDVASREAQMGYALYSEAVQLPSGGALIQALGISDSGLLYPSVQHLLLDDPAVLLLCSDGLSDYDRVEALAPHLIAPLTTAPGPLSPAVAALIEQANRLNGHDNVTVGLMRFIPQPSPLPTLPAGSLRQADNVISSVPRAANLTEEPAAASATRLVAPAPPADLAPTPAPSGFPWAAFLGGMGAVLAVLAGLGLAVSRSSSEPVALQPLATRWSLPALTGRPLPEAALAAIVEVQVGSFWQSALGAVGNGELLRLNQQPALSSAAEALPMVATGSVLRVVSRQTTADNVDWVQLRVCSIPSGESLEQQPQETDQSPPALSPAPDLGQRLLAPGEEGWVQTRQLYGAAAFLELVTPAQAGRCTP